MASASTGTVLDAALGALEASQREAVLSDHRAPLLVSAGAGSGKTRVLTLRIAHLIERGGARPEQILALTFTRKACSEMQERVQRFCPMIARHTLTVKTFHSFCLEIVRDFWQRLQPFAREAPFLIDAVAQAELIKECIEGLNPSKMHEVRSWRPDETQLDIRAEDDEGGNLDEFRGGGSSGLRDWGGPTPSSGLQNAVRYFVAWLRKSSSTSPGRDAGSVHDCTSESMLLHGGSAATPTFASGRHAHAGEEKEVGSTEQELKQAYEREKRKRNSVDFDDLLPLTLSLLRRDSSVRQMLQNRFKYVLVDEFQDVSPLQFELIVELTNERRDPCLTACGDPDQGIYSFLYGNARSNFEQFVRRWPATRLVKLTKNFRSHGIIVKAAASVIANNPSAPTSTAAHCWTDNQQGKRISVSSFARNEGEVKWVCDEIERCRREGVPLRQMAVLFRLRTIGKLFDKELKKRKVPLLRSMSHGCSPYRKALAMDAMAYLKLALTDDDKAFERVLNKPKRGLGGGTLEKLRQTQGRFKCSLLQAAKRASRTEVKGHLSTAQQKGTQAFLKIISDLRRDVEEKSAVDVMRSMVRRIYSEAAGSKSKKGKDDDEFLMAKIVTEFISDLLMAQGLDDDQATVRAGGASAELGRTVRELSTFINAVAELDTEGLKRMRESEVLTLTTIHQAKGLEWSHVWVVHMAEGICPLKRNMDCDDDQAMEQQRDEFLQEERRLAYVAITRAKEVLHMSWVSTDNQTGEQMFPSRFIREIPEDYKQVPGAFSIQSTGSAAKASASSSITHKDGAGRGHDATRPTMARACASGSHDSPRTPLTSAGKGGVLGNVPADAKDSVFTPQAGASCTSTLSSAGRLMTSWGARSSAVLQPWLCGRDNKSNAGNGVGYQQQIQANTGQYKSSIQSSGSRLPADSVDRTKDPAELSRSTIPLSRLEPRFRASSHIESGSPLQVSENRLSLGSMGWSEDFLGNLDNRSEERARDNKGQWQKGESRKDASPPGKKRRLSWQGDEREASGLGSADSHRDVLGGECSSGCGTDKRLHRSLSGSDQEKAFGRTSGPATLGRAGVVMSNKQAQGTSSIGQPRRLLGFSWGRRGAR